MLDPVRQASFNVPAPVPLLSRQGYGHQARKSFGKVLSFLQFGCKWSYFQALARGRQRARPQPRPLANGVRLGNIMRRAEGCYVTVPDVPSG